MPSDIEVNIKMYKVGELGDCFLLTFLKGSKIANLLIDFGSFRNTVKSISRLKKIARDIKKQLKGNKLDVVVGTHQHNDHLSGFVHCKDDFVGIVDQVWLSWLDNPRSKAAQTIGDEHGNLRNSVTAIADSLKLIKSNPNAKEIAGKLNDILGFYGVNTPIIPAEGIKVLKSLGEQDPKYLIPGQIKNLNNFHDNEVRIYVLGPPKNKDLLYDATPSKDETYDPKLSSAVAFSNNLKNAIKNYTNEISKEEEHFPFNKIYKIYENKKNAYLSDTDSKNANKIIENHYRTNDNKWRTIDNDWLEQAERLALYLDTFTNNSSLVLAIELVKSEKVLLFAADAQTGNWKSWFDVKFEDKQTTTKDLLSRTVLYKVGHHGSHNATLVAAMEMMKHEDLVAIIPVDKTDANITKKNGWKMPASNLYKNLLLKTNHRILRMDEGYASGCNPTSEPAKSSWKKSKVKVNNEELYVEVIIKG